MKLTRLAALTPLALVALAASASAAPVKYTVDKDHTEVGFVVRHVFSQVHGRFNDFQGTIVFDDQNPANISVDATAEAKSVWTNNDHRDAHLRTADFFAVDSFPTLSFKSTKVTPDGKGKYKVAGNLTLRGVTKPVVFDAEFLGAGDFGIGGHSMGNKAGFTATTVINRKDYGINWNKMLDNGGWMLDDNVTIELNIEGNSAQ
ncbi:MAG TPA: YceI family protein [Candidatus Acidoferrales bacterium]|nr:YceI family protein [Candidatus Acidoferrales bacterium]